MSEPTRPERGDGDEPAPSLFLLVGPPAAGKLTLARALERRTGAIVVDNHLVNNAVFVPIGLNRAPGVRLEGTDALRARVWDVVIEATEAAPAHLSHVFTIWLEDAPGSAAHVERLRSLAGRRGVRFVPVWVRAGTETLLERVDDPGRAERGKLTDPGTLREILALPLLPAPEDAIELDTGELSPERAVDAILGR